MARSSSSVTHHAAFAAAQRRRLREVEHRHVAEAADHAAVVARADGLGRVFDQLQAALVGQRAELLPRRRVAVDVAGQDGLGGRCDLRRGAHRVEAARPVVDVGKHHARAGQRDGVRHLVPAVGRGDHLVARADAQRAQREPGAERAAGHGHRVLAAEPLREALLEVLRPSRPADRRGSPSAACTSCGLDLAQVGVGRAAASRRAGRGRRRPRRFVRAAGRVSASFMR